MNKNIIILVIGLITTLLCAQRIQYEESFSKKDWDSIIAIIKTDSTKLKPFLLNNNAFKNNFKDILLSRCIDDLYKIQYESYLKLNKKKIKKEEYPLLDLYKLSVFYNSKFMNYIMSDKPNLFSIIDDYSKNVVFMKLQEFKDDYYKMDYIMLNGIDQMSPLVFCKQLSESNNDKYFKQLIEQTFFYYPYP